MHLYQRLFLIGVGIIGFVAGLVSGYNGYGTEAIVCSSIGGLVALGILCYREYKYDPDAELS